jgi:hypothetical protein
MPRPTNATPRFKRLTGFRKLKAGALNAGSQSA